MLKIVLLNEFPLAALTEVWNLCWLSPPPNGAERCCFTVEHLKAYLFIHKIALPYSVGLSVKDQLIGFALFGINEGEGWIGSLGVVPGHRGKGLSAILLDYQLAVSRKLKLRQISLEVEEHHFIAKVYHAYGFRIERELNSFMLLKRDLAFLDVYRTERYSYQRVFADVYFAARNKVGLFFSWKRRDYILKNYPKNAYYLGPAGASGFIMQKSGMLGDIWAFSHDSARGVLAAAAEHVEKIVIKNQSGDNLSTYLRQRSVQPFCIHYEMIRNMAAGEPK
jgi:ribosomal protein S18 acetylase RimI-like enzyme